jgi:site-specific DNA-methyltransferase (adenine-specific)
MSRWRLLKGDCLDRLDEVADASVDLVLCDPPYGTIRCAWDSIIPLEPLWSQLYRVAKPGAAFVMTASQPFTTTLIASNMEAFQYCWTWEKSKPSNFLNCKKQPMRKVEDVAVFCRQSCLYNPQGLELGSQNSNSGNERTYGDVKDEWSQDETFTNYPHNLLRFANIVGAKAIHPTQKPVALMAYLIKTYTNKRATVLDFTMGSGTTGVACANTGRRFIGVEMDDVYFAIAKKRIIERYTGKRGLLPDAVVGGE